MQSSTQHGRVLKLADGIMTFPKKKRFNQDLDESIKDIKDQQYEKSRHGGNSAHLKTFVERHKSDGSVFDGRSNSQGSFVNSAKKSRFSTLSKDQLDKFFKDKKAKLDEDT